MPACLACLSASATHVSPIPMPAFIYAPANCTCMHACLYTCRYVSFVVATAVIWVLVAVVWGLGSHFKARARQR